MSDKINNTKAEDIIDGIEDSETENLANNQAKEAIEMLKKMQTDELIEIILNQQQAIVENQSKILELTSLAKRVQADFDNYRKRNNENLVRIRQDATVDVIERFLSTLDIIDQAITMIKDEQILGGIKMMRKQLMEVFEAYGVVEIDAFDKAFDPNLHEAVFSEDNSEKSGKVLEVLRKGYKMGDKVLRYAAVKVAN